MTNKMIPEINALCEQEGIPRVLQHAWSCYTIAGISITNHREENDGAIMISAPLYSDPETTVILYELFAEEAPGRESRYGIAVTSPKEQKSVPLDWEAMRDFILNTDRIELLPDGTIVTPNATKENGEGYKQIIRRLETSMNAQIEK